MMKIKYDPTGKIRQAQPDLTNAEIDAAISAEVAKYIAAQPDDILANLFIDQYLKNTHSLRVQLTGFIDGNGELHEYDSPITRLPLACCTNGPQRVYFYQHGMTGFTFNKDGEHTSEIWQECQPTT